MKNKIAVIGENRVQTALHSILSSKGFDCYILNPDEHSLTETVTKKYDTVILPFPSRDKSISFFKEKNCSELFSNKQTIAGGMFEKEVRAYFENNGNTVVDYYLDEAYVIRNAVLTVQGVLKSAFENTDTFLSGKTALVTGFGRIAKPLCAVLKALGVKVYVAVRSDKQTAEAEISGYDTFRLNAMKGSLFYFDYIFNTVPFNIFDEKDIRHLKGSSVYFEIASKPYGADENYFSIHGKKYVSASALPGKHFPVGVAENIADYLTRKGVIT